MIKLLMILKCMGPFFHMRGKWTPYHLGGITYYRNCSKCGKRQEKRFEGRLPV